ncbi:MAG TPA: alpha/beta hydrolase [Candidatus Nitrosocosmicus sp.]|jgi:dienelactone hydrolase|uniref:dienelactone hydrolase family protein n=1 Tax=Candidatus Nitrosocosmicus sp. FF01 TaxID=3397670 RepID=UPI002DC28CB7|nr:alpha/beta hydrolase [Candidatus Nitrosocosmicus sp.]
MTVIRIPLDGEISGSFIYGEVRFPSNPKGLVIFAHGSGSNINSSRNRYVAQVLNENGYATILADLLTQEEQQSDMKSQKILDKYPGIVLNKFNIQLLSNRLVLITKWIINNTHEVIGLPIGYFGASTGAAAAIEASLSPSLSEKLYTMISRGGRPDLARSESIRNVKVSTLLIVGEKDSKQVVELNRKIFKQMKNSRYKEFVVIPHAGHLFEEANTIEHVANVSTQWFNRFLEKKWV